MTGAPPPRSGRPSRPDDAPLPVAGLDPAAWSRAGAAQVLPVDYARRGPDGQWRGVYTAVPIAHPPQWCDHLDSMCRSCLPAWAEDYTIALFRHGPTGARAGCACPTCRTCHPRTTRPGTPGELPGDDRPGQDPTGGDPASGQLRALFVCLPDVSGHHRHLTVKLSDAVPTASPRGPQPAQADRRLVIVTIPSPSKCPGAGHPGREDTGNGTVDMPVDQTDSDRHDCRRDDATAVPFELLAAAAQELEAVADLVEEAPW